MKFRKGISGNPNGRPTGTPNKTSASLRTRINIFLSDNFETIESDFQSMSPIERTRFYLALLKFGLPQLQAVSIDRQIESMSDTQLDEIISLIECNSVTTNEKRQNV
jgi:hypothetical protein